MGRNEPIRKVSHRSGAQPSEIPDKLYFRIGEVAKLCEVPAYVLRFWESEFPQLKPNKGGTGQRLYRRRDVEMAMRVKRLLYDEGYTIPGARQLLKAELKHKEPQIALVATEPSDPKRLLPLRRELEALAALLAKPIAKTAIKPSPRSLAPTVAKAIVTQPINEAVVPAQASVPATAVAAITSSVQSIRARQSEEDLVPATHARPLKRQPLGPSLFGSLFDEPDSSGDGS